MVGFLCLYQGVYCRTFLLTAIISHNICTGLRIQSDCRYSYDSSVNNLLCLEVHLDASQGFESSNYYGSKMEQFPDCSKDDEDEASFFIFTPNLVCNTDVQNQKLASE